MLFHKIMIRVLSFSLFLGITLATRAQGSLQFNQVKLLEGTQSGCTVCWTVPAGKVWKVGSFSSNSSSNFYYYVNNRQLGFFSTSGVQTTDPRYAYPFPFWLPSGATFGYSGISSNTNITFFALEFNVIP